MLEYGTWNQPAGTWSDDSSLTFCLAESLSNGYNTYDIANNFVKWKTIGFWGAHNSVFDIGIATAAAILRLQNGIAPELAGGFDERDNGNGSLMRILPLLFHIYKLPIEERFKKIREVSSITHAHFRSFFSCFVYLELARELLEGNDAQESYDLMQKKVNQFIAQNDFNPTEIKLFVRVLESNIKNETSTKIHASGYVLHTLEAAIWCLLNSTDYRTAVLTAVNLGEDTDTVACITGGLAGLLYGCENIPQKWIDQIARTNDIQNLCERFNKSVES